MKTSYFKTNEIMALVCDLSVCTLKKKYLKERKLLKENSNIKKMIINILVKVNTNKHLITYVCLN